MTGKVHTIRQVSNVYIFNTGPLCSLLQYFWPSVLQFYTALNTQHWLFDISFLNRSVAIRNSDLPIIGNHQIANTAARLTSVMELT